MSLDEPNFASGRSFLKMRWLRELCISTWPSFLTGAICQASIVLCSLATLQIIAGLVAIQTGGVASENSSLTLNLLQAIFGLSPTALSLLFATIAIYLASAVFEFFGAYSISWSYSRVINAASKKFFAGTVYASSASTDARSVEAIGPQRWLALNSVPLALHNVVLNGMAAAISLIGVCVLTAQENITAGAVLIAVILFWGTIFALLHAPMMRASAAATVAQEDVGIAVKDSARAADILIPSSVLSRFLRSQSYSIATASRTIRLQGWVGSLLYAILTFVVLATAPALAVIVLLSAGQDGISSAAAVFIFASRLQGPLGTLSQLAPQLQKHFVDWRRMDVLFEPVWMIGGRDAQTPSPLLALEFRPRITDHSTRHTFIPKWSKFRAAVGATVSVVGPVGAGKTTLLRALAGRGVSDQHVEVAEYSPSRPLLEITRKQRCERVVFVPQFPVLVGASVDDFFWIISGIRLDELLISSAEWLGPATRSRLKAIDLHQRPETLSGGERKLISICAALASDAAILFIDEPSASLDPNLSGVIASMIEIAAKQRIIVLGQHPPAGPWIVGTEVSSDE